MLCVVRFSLCCVFWIRGSGVSPTLYYIPCPQYDSIMLIADERLRNVNVYDLLGVTQQMVAQTAYPGKT